MFPRLPICIMMKPLQKHTLIQTISRVNRKFPGKEYGLVVDYIGIRDNMRAMKLYGGDSSVAPLTDDAEQAANMLKRNFSILKDLFAGYDFTSFLDPDGTLLSGTRLLAKAAESVLLLQKNCSWKAMGEKAFSKVSFKTYFLTTVKRMRAAYDLCQPSGELDKEEAALAQCFMAIAGFVRKISGTSEVDTDTMNRYVAKMVEKALEYSQVEGVLGL